MRRAIVALVSGGEKKANWRIMGLAFQSLPYICVCVEGIRRDLNRTDNHWVPDVASRSLLSPKKSFYWTDCPCSSYCFETWQASEMTEETYFCLLIVTFVFWNIFSFLFQFPWRIFSPCLPACPANWPRREKGFLGQKRFRFIGHKKVLCPTILGLFFQLPLLYMDKAFKYNPL